VGPITLFDKSFLQSLNVDESVWFDHFFYSVICPIFYVETLADLEKAVRQGRTPEQEVGYIADKSPEFHRNPCSHHRTLCIGNLMSHDVPMNGQIPVTGGHYVKTDEGKKGLVFEHSQEAQALSRWQDGKFLELERKFAKVWRRSLENLDLLATASSIRAMGIDEKTCKSLDQAKRMAEGIISSGQPVDIIKLASIFLGFSLVNEKSIMEAWGKADYNPLPIYAPYAAHVLTIEIFFQIALGSNLISTQQPSNRTDIAYLFYLPFCMIFVSSDKLHQRCAPLFMRKDQEFVWGLDLKADLKRLNEHYSSFPDKQKKEGITRFASTPPQEDDCLVGRLWDRHLRSWRNQKSSSPKMDPEAEKKLVERLKNETKSRRLSPDEIDFDAASADFMSIEHKVRKRKGSWWQLPKDLEVSDVEEKHVVMMKEARRLADALAASLPDRIQIAALTLDSKIPFKALSFRELLIHRVSSLASSAIDLFERDQIIPAIILTRSIMETVALIYALHERLTNFLNDNEKLELDSFLMRCLFGFHDDPQFPKSIDVLTFVNAVEKTIPRFRKMYDIISEYAYPNYSGLLGSFGKIDKKKFELQLGPQNMKRALIVGVSALSIALRIFTHYYDDSSELVRRVNDFFERGASY
jgi:hypothetical protein